MSVSLDDIKYFLFVSETLNITRASERAGVTQPTLSYSIKRLERDLNGELLIRLKNGVKLTRLGKEFTVKARGLVSDWEEIQRIAKNENGEVSGTYTLGIHPSVALYTLEHFMPKLVNDYPKLQFEFFHGLSREVTEKVINWELDFGIVVNPKKHPDLMIKELCQDQVGLFGLSKSNDTLIYDGDLNQTEYVYKKLKLNPKQLITSGNLEVISKMAATGVGNAILPGRVASQHKSLKMLDKKVFYKDRICLIYRMEKHKDASGKTIIDAIKNTNFK